MYGKRNMKKVYIFISLLVIIIITFILFILLLLPMDDTDAQNKDGKTIQHAKGWINVPTVTPYPTEVTY